MPLSAAVYIRVSTDEQAREGVSLDVQEAECRARALALGAASVTVYADPGLSGMTLRRPQLQRLIADLDRYAMLVVWSVDRLARPLEDRLAVSRMLHEAGVQLVSLHEAASTATAADLFSFQVQGAAAEFEVNRTRERVKAALSHIASVGAWPGNPPFGYMRGDGVAPGTAQTRPLVPDATTAPLVRDLFTRAARGERTSSLARMLNDAQVPRHRGGRSWTPGYVSYILTNPLYRGAVHWGAVDRMGTHEPLVDARTWRRVQDGLRARARVAGHDGLPRSLSPLLRCGECGGRVTKSCGGLKQQPFYRCRAWDMMPAEERHAHRCAHVPVAKCEEAIWRQFALDLSPEALTEAIGKLASQTAHETSQRRTLERRLGELDEALERTVRLVAQGYPADVVERGSVELVEERAAVVAALESEATGRSSLEVLRRLRGVDVPALVTDAREAPPERQVDLLRGMYAEVRVWRDRVQFVPVVGAVVTRALPRYWGRERGGAWGW